MFSTRFTNLNGGIKNNNLILFQYPFMFFNLSIGLLIFIVIHGVGDVLSLLLCKQEDGIEYTQLVFKII